MKKKINNGGNSTAKWIIVIQALLIIGAAAYGYYKHTESIGSLELAAMTEQEAMVQRALAEKYLKELKECRARK